MRLRGMIGVVFIVLLGGGAAYLAMGKNRISSAVDGKGLPPGAVPRKPESGAAPVDERERAWKDAVAKGAVEKDSWPQTPEALIREFWQAAARKDIDRLLVLCPGAIPHDFKSMKQWTPSPAISIGPAARDPRNPGVVLYPVTVPFPYFPNKTIRMAIARLADGRLIVDGQNTLWW